MDYVVKYGDTVRMIAQRELGDAELWVNIVEINNLVYPYIDTTPSEGVATPGDIIKLPVENDTNFEEPSTSFGSDLYLSTDKVNLSFNKGGDFAISVDGDYEIITELNCLKQDLSHRQMTPLGTLPYHPSYGSEITTMIGNKKDENWKIKAMLEVERTAKCDPRITEISDVNIEDLTTGIKITYSGIAEGIQFRSGGVEDEEI